MHSTRFPAALLRRRTIASLLPWLAAGFLAVSAAAPAATPTKREAAPPATPATSEAIAARLRDAALAGKGIDYAWLSELTTRFGPRPAGSLSEQTAAEWAAARLKELGFENVRIESFPVVAWMRGTESAQILSPAAQPLVVAALGESPPTPAAGLEGDVAIFAGFEALKSAPAGSLTGRIALVAARTVRTQDGAGYAAAVAARIDGPREAARCGAIAYLVRSVGTDSHRMPHTGTTRYVEGRVPLPAFALSAPDADQIERLASLGQPVRVRLFSSAAYLRDAHSQNVLAEVRGREHPEEVVLLGAHLDSWDLGTGALDDGAGTAIITAAAKLILEAPHRPRRTVRVVLYGSEEVAQPGSPDSARGGHAYADSHKVELALHVLAGESDLGADRVYAVGLPQAVASGEFAERVHRVLAPVRAAAGCEPLLRHPSHGR